jgi:serine/threonine-protein kinase
VIAERGPLAPVVAVSYLIQTAVALHAAHRQGVVHRDVKPGNILVLADGSVKVTDFGVAHVVDSTSVTDAGHMIGTATYLSPEQARADRVSPASDVYSLGVVGYEMLTGHPPFAASNPAAMALAHVERQPQPLPASLPRAVRDAIHAALSKDPGDRPADALAFADALRGAVFVDEVPTAVLPAVDRTAVMPAAVSPARAHGRQRWVTWATILLLLLGFVAIWAGRAPRDAVPDVPSTTVVPAASVTVAPSVAPSTSPPPTATQAPPAHNEHGKKKDKKGGGHGNG